MVVMKCDGLEVLHARFVLSPRLGRAFCFAQLVLFAIWGAITGIMNVDRTHVKKTTVWRLLLLALVTGHGITTGAAAPEPAGWYAGDMHVHRNCGQFTDYTNTVAEIRE